MLIGFIGVVILNNGIKAYTLVVSMCLLLV